MRFVNQALSISLLFAVSANANFDIKTLAPWAGIAVAGEVIHHLNEDMKTGKTRSPGQKPDNKFEKTMKDVSTAFVGGMLMNALRRKPMTGNTLTDLGVDTAKSFLALKMSKFRPATDWCRKVPVLRGIVTNAYSKDDNKMTPSALVRYGLAMLVVDKACESTGILAKDTTTTPAETK